ncbi:MAG: PD-(D/E)XK nuclease family protein [Flavobacteriaceae bacterium]|nr:PD-(D/E)XK nuclease family protein [Flavobacteriaceae bacterium]
MTSFIKSVLEDLKNKDSDFSKLVFVLPSKRAGVVLKNELSNLKNSTFFAPDILSVEAFVEELSNLKSIQNIELLFLFYKIYRDNTEKEYQEPFDSFSKWAQIILQDFNEIDRYLINPESVFDYLNEIQKINTNHWSIEKNQTEFTKRYLKFWSKLNQYYTDFSNLLINLGVGYQGLIYREAVENIENYIQANQSKQHVFLGFNALNTAESNIIQELLENEMASVYWDIDLEFINSKIHNAAHFINSHKTKWNYYKTKSFNWVSNNYKAEKNIEIIGVPQNIGQAKVIGELLSDLKEKKNLADAAVVLGDEALLIPVLNSLPRNIDALNITMGFPLKDTPLTSLFEQLFIMHSQSESSFYFKDVISIVSHQYIRPLFKISDKDEASELIKHIQQNNLVFISESKLLSISSKNKPIISLLFGNWNNQPKTAISNILRIIISIKNSFESKKENALALEYLYRFNEVFNMLFELNSKHNAITSLKILQGLFRELVSSETLDFKGEPLKGLQIMGMLESRVLDFETVIISSVNEGILPSGKSNNSFIPFDVKLEKGLPTYAEKDAVYTYHFYRLLQRAKNIFIIYNTEVDALNGGEKSRFITQLEIESTHKIKQKFISPKVPKIETKPNIISKNEAIISKLKEISAKGFSPSSLTSYIRNPMDFYYEKVLGIKETDDVEEIVAANTLGTIIHNTLEGFYKPLEGNYLTVKLIKMMISKIDASVEHHFLDIYKQGDIKSGKNLIIFEIAKRYVFNFLNLEIDALKEGNTIKIISIESDLNIPIEISELDFPVRLRGKVDRVDEYNGTTRIIDYKTGKVDQNKVQLEHWDDVITDYDKYSKSFQVLCYALMINNEARIIDNVEGGIISFKNLSSGFIKFYKLDREGGKLQKNSNINQNILNAFAQELKKLILEIFDPKIDFIEKEV